MLIFKQKNPFFPSPPPPPPTGGGEKGKEKLVFAARTLTLNKQYLHSLHQIYVEKYYLIQIYLVYQKSLKQTSKTSFKYKILMNLCDRAVNLQCFFCSH